MKIIKIDIFQVDDGTHKGLHSITVQFFEKHQIPYKDLMVGFAADGANVNFGKEHSVAKLFGDEIDHLFILKCVCHSLALGVSHAVKELPDTVEEFLSSVYSYYKNSGKRQLALGTTQLELDLPDHQLLQYKKVRWLSLHSAVARCLEQYDAVFKSLEAQSRLENKTAREKNGSATSILNKMKSLWTKLYLHFLDFVLPIINEKNRLFQSEEPKIHQLHGQMDSLFKTICRMYLKEDYVDRMDIEDLDFSLGKNNEENLEPLRNLDLGPVVTVELMKLASNFPVSEIEKFRSCCRNFFVVFLEELYKRFPFKEPSVKLIRQLGFIDPVNLKDTKNIHMVADFFKKNVVDVHAEFRKLKDIFRHKCDTDIITFWRKVEAEVRADGSSEFPLILDIVRRARVLPHTSADVERVFSCINMNKTKMRNRTENELLTGILHGKELVKNQSIAEIDVKPLLPYMNKNMY